MGTLSIETMWQKNGKLAAWFLQRYDLLADLSFAIVRLSK
jgi:hypothetical protein